ncbi:MAG: DUF4292 domain-containing protein [Bacteroidales bacterium]|nr:DUF4292 domain-containing protein [Bacteroidales bacterium]
MKLRAIIICAALFLAATGCTRLRDLPDTNSAQAQSSQDEGAIGGNNTLPGSSSGKAGSNEATGTDTPGTAQGTTASETAMAPLCETMTVSCGYEGMAASGQVRMQQDSVIWVSVSYFFELGRAMATRDRVRIDVKMLGKSFDGTYADLARVTGVNTSFDELQAILSRDTAGEELSAIARRMGYNVRIKVSNRKKAESLSFPM